MPKSTTHAPTATAPMAGHLKFRFRLSQEVLRQASSGPIEVRSRRSSATGMFTRLKKGAPTVTFAPCTHSEILGKSVPHRTVKHATSNSRLLNKKLDSREISESNLFSLRK